MKRLIRVIFAGLVCVLGMGLFFAAALGSLFASQNLTIKTAASNSVALSWSTTNVYSLQTNAGLSATNWAAFKGQIVTSNGTNTATIAGTTGNQFFRLSPQGAGGFSNPSSIPGLVYYWNFNDLTVSNAVTAWTDRVSGLVLQMTAKPAPTNQNIGVFFNQTPNPLTNATIQISSNFSLWCVFRPNTNYTVTSRNVLFGSTNGYGFGLSNSMIEGRWGAGSEHVSSVSLQNGGAPLYPAAVDYDQPAAAITYDIVDSCGTLYTNGVLAGTNAIGQPTNNFPFQCVGSQTNVDNVMGSIQYIGIWTNYALTPNDVSNLDNWVNTNGVTNVTGGLLAWYKFDEGSGTNIADSSGNGNNGYVVGNAKWTNGVIGDCFNFDGYTQIVTKNFADNLPVWTVSMWVWGTNFWTGTNAAAVHGSQFLGKTGPGGSDNGTGWGLVSDNAANIFPYVQDQNGWHEGGRPQVAGGAWHFVVCSFVTATVWSYLDGALYVPFLDGPGGTVSVSNSDPVIIGGDNENWDVSAYIDDVRIYNRILTPAEIAILYRWRGQM